MTERDQVRIDTTRQKLASLEERYEASRQAENGTDPLQRLSQQSLKRLINQLKEELVRLGQPVKIP